MTTSTEPSRIVPLTSARFFAAFYVLLYHGVPNLPSLHNHHGLFTRIVSLGYVSVSFFFMLSGFILTIVYLKSNAPLNKRRFFVSRFARIYPLYLAALMLDLPHFLYAQRYITHASTERTLLSLIASIGLVQAWFVNLVGGLNAPSWSLSAEAFFYLLFPFVSPLLWRLRGRSVLWLSGLIYLGGIWLVKTVDGTRFHISKQSYNPIPHLFVFLLGIILAKFFVWIGRTPERSMLLQRTAPWLLLGSVVLFLTIPVFNLQIPENLMQHNLLAPLFALVILALASGNRVLFLLFSLDWLMVLGEASFALYLIHVPIASILRRWIEQYGTPMFLIYAGVTVALSVASLKWFEGPARRWILKKERVRSLETEVTSALSQ
jgi:peptidoglycan/LPS O-acetylase OafA/YrhL